MRSLLGRNDIAWDKYEVASFDVFDTLVERLVCKPTDAFRIVESRALKSGWDAEGFSRQRVEAERRARKLCDGETTIDEIYDSFDAGFPARAHLAALKELEIEVEKAICVTKNAGRRLFDEALARGKRVAITSDMYLPADVVASVLERCGYSGWESLFVSCECGATKASGALYALLVEAMGVPASSVLHIGDNGRSDILRAKGAGLDAFRIAAPSMECSSLAESFVKASANHFLNGDHDDLFDMGYALFGPLLMGFSSWLHDAILNQGIERVYFLARDGLIMRRAFEVLFPGEIDTRYLYASRRALQVPSFATLNSFEEIVSSMFLPRTVSLKKLFVKMGLDAQSVCGTLSAAGINAECERPSAGLVECTDAKRAFELLEDDIMMRSDHELELLQEYLRQMDFGGRCAIVDIGWFGNMQVALERVAAYAGIPIELHGYYVGLQPTGANQLSHKMEGYLFDASHGERIAHDERNFNLIFETLFSACHGTTRGYAITEAGVVMPVLADYTGWEQSIGNQAQKMREGALQFVADAKRIFADAVPNVAPELAFEALDALGNRPTRKEAEFFGEWAMEADEELVYAAKPCALGHYIIHPHSFASDFSHAPWKVGFMRRLFKLPLPYDRLWGFVHDAYKKAR